MMSNINVEIELRRTEIGTYVVHMTTDQFKQFRADRSIALQLKADQDADFEPFVDDEIITGWKVI